MKDLYQNVFVSYLLAEDEMTRLFHKYHMGIESIEFSVGENLDHCQERLTAYQSWCQQINCNNLILHGPFLDLNPVSYDSLIRKASYERMHQCYEAAKYLNAKKIVYHTCFVPTTCYLTGWAERQIEFWKQFLSEHQDIMICLENVFDPQYEPLKDIVTGVNMPNFRLCLDLGHINAYSKQTWQEWVNNLKGFIGHVHLHNNHSERDEHNGILDGTLPIKSIMKEIKEDNQEVTWTIECLTESQVEEFLMELPRIL